MSDKTEFSKPPQADGNAVIKQPCLIMIKGDHIGQVYEVSDDVTVIGRSDEADITVMDPNMSRRHAMIVYRDGAFFVSDLNSTNGTFVNQEQVETAYSFDEGDKLTFGDVTFKFSYQDEYDTQYHQAMRNMAVTDGLTGIYNMGYFTELLEKEMSYNRRSQMGLAIVVFEIDSMGLINDRFGHIAGDLVLKELALLLEKEGRGYDVFARYVNEQFVLLMRDVKLSSAAVLAERIRALIESHAFAFEEQELDVTLSLGAAYWNGGEQIACAEDFFILADHALNAARQAGGNCVKY
jgi:two-component system cell cycle response regulator